MRRGGRGVASGWGTALIPFVVLVVAWAGAGPGEGWAAYPEKTIRLLIGFAAGDTTDVLGRLLAKGLEKDLRVSVVPVNKPGAGGALAYDEVRRARPDGYTLGWVTGSLFTVTSIGNVNWEYKALDPVARIAQWPMVVGVRADAPWKSWKDFLDDARRNPGKYRFGHAGTGSIGHLLNVALIDVPGVKVIMAPVGAAERFPALLGGKIDLLSAPVPGFVKFVKAGQMRPLAVASPKRIEVLPEVPTARELGFGFDLDLMYGVFVPAGTPDAVKSKLQGALKRVVAEYEPLHKYAKTLSLRIDYLDGAPLDRYLEEQDNLVTRLMKNSGLYKSRLKK